MTSKPPRTAINEIRSQEGLPFSASELLMFDGFSAQALGNLIGVTSRTVRARQGALRAKGVKPPDLMLMTSQVALALAQQRGGGTVAVLCSAGNSGLSEDGV
jgi:hypothetical protein